MPYIDPHRRTDIDPRQRARLDRAGTAGELNFQLTVLCDQFILDEGGNYAAINSAIGALECAKLELYRRIAAPYEDTKIEENGDVYTPR